jgi:hypothetical protein
MVPLPPTSIGASVTIAALPAERLLRMAHAALACGANVSSSDRTSHTMVSL